jgi:hypothetical protein
MHWFSTLELLGSGFPPEYRLAVVPSRVVAPIPTNNWMSFALRVNQSCYERGEGPAQLRGWKFIDYIDQEKRYTSVWNQTRNIRLWLWQSSMRKTSEVTKIVDGQPTQVIELDHPSYASIYTQIRIAPTQKQLLRTKLAPAQCRSWLTTACSYIIMCPGFSSSAH